jgi:hypothetical protein
MNEPGESHKMLHTKQNEQAPWPELLTSIIYFLTTWGGVLCGVQS